MNQEQRIKELEAENKNTLVISAFPGTGKTYLSGKVNALDSDSSAFSWLPKTKIRNQAFPFNYIKHIKENIGRYDFIFVSSHKEVRTCLVQYSVDFLSVYPEKALKDEYLDRYRQRGNDNTFIEMMDKNWDLFIDGMKDLEVMQPLILKSGEYLSDYFLLNQGTTDERSVATMPNSTTEADKITNNPLLGEQVIYVPDDNGPYDVEGPEFADTVRQTTLSSYIKELNRV
jgi:hypothetical protein